LWFIHYKCTKVKQRAVAHQQLASQYGQNCLPQQSAREWIKTSESGQTGDVDPDRKTFCPLSLLDHKKYSTTHCSSLVQTSSSADIFMPCSLGTNGLQLNHTCSMPLFDLESIVLPGLSSICNYTTKIFINSISAVLMNVHLSFEEMFFSDLAFPLVSHYSLVSFILLLPVL